MKALILIASVLLAACGGSKPGVHPSTVPMETAEVADCIQACDRVAVCWQKQYGQQDAEGDRADCETRCAGMTEEEQPAFLEANGAATTCKQILDL